MTPQQVRTVKRLGPAVPFIVFGSWLAVAGHHRAAVGVFGSVVTWLLVVELLAVGQGGESTESELTWRLWASQPWVVWLVSVLLARTEGWFARDYFDVRYLQWTSIGIPVVFLCGHFFAQSADVYNRIRTGKPEP